VQEQISKAYKQFNQLKLDDNRRDTWIAQLISAQAAAWNKKRRYCGNNCGVRKRFVTQPTT